MKILLVEDDQGQAYLVKDKLSSTENTQITHVSSGKDALNIIGTEKFDLMILDHSLGDMNGIEILKQIRSYLKPEDLPTIMMTGKGNEKIAVDAMKNGAFDYIVKETDLSHLEMLPVSIIHTLDRANILRDNKMLWEQISKKNQELSRISQIKTDFVNNVAHEFRTPLTITKGYVENILDGILGQINDQQKEALNSILKVTDRLSNLVTNLLDISKIEAGKMELKRQKINFIDLLKEAYTQLIVIAQERNIELINTYSQDYIELWCDQEKIMEVLINLVSNAIKATPSQGQIQINVSTYNGFLKVAVKDSGEGIPEDRLSKIFDKFESLSKAGQKGTGLGLSITHDIIKLHKGEIFVESKPGDGATFIFIIPIDLRKENREN